MPAVTGMAKGRGVDQIDRIGANLDIDILAFVELLNHFALRPFPANRSLLRESVCLN